MSAIIRAGLTSTILGGLLALGFLCFLYGGLPPIGDEKASSSLAFTWVLFGVPLFPCLLFLGKNQEMLGFPLEGDPE